MIESTFLEWDSAFFKKKVFKLHLNSQPAYHEIEKKMSETKGEIFYIFSNAEYTVLKKLGAKLYDVKIVFEKRVTKPGKEHADNIESYKGGITEELKQLALLSGTYSRFNLDPNLKYKFEEMYLIWLNRSLTREIADELIVFKDGENIVGFLSFNYKNEIARVGLIAVAENYQNRGIGRALLNSMNERCYERGIQNIEIATQMANKGGCAFYSKLEYSIQSTQYIYHLYRPE